MSGVWLASDLDTALGQLLEAAAEAESVAAEDCSMGYHYTTQRQKRAKAKVQSLREAIASRFGGEQ